MQNRPPHNTGFTIIEMIVTVIIFTFICTSMLISYSGFNKRLNLDTLAHQIGQWVRDAQVSAMSVKSARTSVGTFPGYGLHFDMSTPNRFLYFADLNGNYRYDAGVCGAVGSECERNIVLTQGNRIDALCGTAVGVVATVKCPAPLGPSSVFDIVFTRPNPDAVINGDLFPAPYSPARITVISQSGYKRNISVWSTGQISIQ